MVLHSYLATRKSVHTMEEMATPLTLAIGNMVFFHTLVKMLLWLIKLTLNRMSKWRMLMTLEAEKIMTIMDSLRSNTIKLCIYFMHQDQIIMLLLAKRIMYLMQISTLLQVLLEFHILLFIQILDHGLWTLVLSTYAHP